MPSVIKNRGWTSTKCPALTVRLHVLENPLSLLPREARKRRRIPAGLGLFSHEPLSLNAEKKLRDAQEEQERGLSAVRGGGGGTIHTLSLMGLRHLKRAFSFLFF